MNSTARTSEACKRAPAMVIVIISGLIAVSNPEVTA
jgi:hypothetical protein